MTDQCGHCGADVTPDARSCPRCGHAIDDPAGAVLRGRSAERPRTTTGDLPPGPPGAGEAPRWRGPAAVALLAVALVGLLGLLAGGAYALWMRGAGGEIAFREHNAAGNRAFGQADYRTADAEYTQMIALRPRRADGYLLRGMAEAREGLNARAAADDTAAMAWTRTPMGLGDLYSNRGQARGSQGDLAGAVADYTRSNLLYRQVRDPRDTPDVPGRLRDNYLQRADAYYQRRQYARAVADCSAVIPRLRPRAEDYCLRAKAEAALGRDAAARADFLQALARDPLLLDGYTGLGALADRTRRYAQGTAAYRQATRLQPDDARLWGGLGWFQYEEGKYSQSEASSRRALSQDPGQGWVAYNLGLCYAAQGNGKGAQSAYAAALAHSREADRESGLKDVAAALARQPGSAALRAAQRQLMVGRAVMGPAVRLVPPVRAASPPSGDGRAPGGLGPEVAVGGYALRPPAGYTLTRDPDRGADGDGAAYLWSGPARADGTVPTLEVKIADDGGNLALNYNSAQLTRQYLASMGENHSRLVVSPVRPCALGGRPFARGDWTGVGQRTGKAYAGVAYLSATSAGVIELSGHDAAPYSRSTLPQLRASILTFRKR